MKKTPGSLSRSSTGTNTSFGFFFLVRWGFLLHDWLSPPASHTPAIHAAKCSFIKSFARFPTRFSCIFVFVTTSLEKEKAQSGDESLLISSLSHQKTSARVSVRKFSQSLSVRLSVQTYPPCWSCNKKNQRVQIIDAELN
jgi:hypothetical protein